MLAESDSFDEVGVKLAGYGKSGSRLLTSKVGREKDASSVDVWTGKPVLAWNRLGLSIETHEMEERRGRASGAAGTEQFVDGRFIGVA
jgi:hypothetical protein